GSAGGSLRHGFADAVIGIELVNGKGEVETLSPGDDAFHAAGVAVGLLGVITRVRLRLQPSYFVKGDETNHEERDSFLRKVGCRYELSRALDDVEFLHLNWYPQKEVRRVTQFVGISSDVTVDRDEYQSALKDDLMNVLAAAVLAITSAAST